MFEIKYELDFLHQARTIYPKFIGFNLSGWTIEGNVVTDYYSWVNDFKATHPDYGFVEGNFENVVKATSEETLNTFLKEHPIDFWNYLDI